MNIYRKIVLGFFKSSTLKGSIKILEDRVEHIYGEEGKEPVVIKVQDPRFYKKIVLNGDIGLGEAYFLGYFESKDLKKLFEWFVENKNELPGFNSDKKFYILFELTALIARVSARLNKNTRRGSKKNIKYHYDVSNDFYKLWLDETMTYSSAIFEEGMSLQEAQKNKYKRICEKLAPEKGDHLLEIGSGWGGFAIYASSNYPCRVTSITISREQYKLAKTRIEDAGLSDRVEIKLLDYRDLDGQYDKLVSIEMMEALGHEYLKEFLKKCDQVLKPGGNAVLQCITYPDLEFDRYLKNNDYIKKYIFPGGELVSLKQLKSHVTDIKTLSIKKIESIGLDYAKTLALWAKNFKNNKAKILEMGFDEKFFRMWYYYFVYCEAGFTTRYLDNVQIKIEKNEKEKPEN